MQIGDWAIVFTIIACDVGLAGLMIALYNWQNTRNDEAHKHIGENIDGVKADIKEVRSDIKEVNIFLRNHFAEKTRKGKHD